MEMKRPGAMRTMFVPDSRMRDLLYTVNGAEEPGAKSSAMSGSFQVQIKLNELFSLTHPLPEVEDA